MIIRMMMCEPDRAGQLCTGFMLALGCLTLCLLGQAGPSCPRQQAMYSVRSLVRLRLRSHPGSSIKRSSTSNC